MGQETHYELDGWRVSEFQGNYWWEMYLGSPEGNEDHVAKVFVEKFDNEPYAFWSALINRDIAAWPENPGPVSHHETVANGKTETVGEAIDAALDWIINDYDGAVKEATKEYYKALADDLERIAQYREQHPSKSKWVAALDYDDDLPF